MKAQKQTIVNQYWLKELSGKLEKASLPSFVNAEATMAETAEKSQLQLEIDNVTANQLKKASKNSDTALFVLFLSGLSITLNKYTGIDDILVGTTTPKTSGINELLFCRNRLSRDLTPGQLINQTSQVVLKAFNYADYSFEEIFETIRVKLGSESLDIFNTAFIYQALQNKSKSLRRFQLLLVLLAEGDRLFVQAEFNHSLYAPAIVQRFVNNLINLLDKLSQMLNLKIQDIDILSNEEREELLFVLNKTAAAYPKGSTIHRLFEIQVEKTPHHIALVFEDQQLTYNELNKRANPLARLLRRKGVKADSIVGLMMERSIEMMIGILGILKAGGAYLPIEPDTPGKRALSMMQDCQTSILLTQNSLLEKHNITVLQGLESARAQPYLTGIRPQIKELDRLPLPDRTLVNYEAYHQHIGVAMAKHTVSIMGTRGCPYKCAYCHKIWPKSHIIRSSENIFTEILNCYNAGIKRFVIIDDIFNLHRKNSSQLYRLIIQHGLEIQLFFPGGMRGDILTKDYIDLMFEAGTVNVMLALETASPRLQKMLGKNLDIQRFEENLQYIVKYYPHIILEVNIMHGFPSETEEEALMSLDFMKRYHWIHFPNMNILKIYPNTDMEKLALEHGISKEAIERSTNFAYHELPDTLPFEKSFTLKVQTELFNDYLMSKERFLAVLPHQMKVLTEDEIVQKYDSYLPADIKNFTNLLEFIGISREQLSTKECLPKENMAAPGFREKMKKYSFTSTHTPAASTESAFRIFLLDVSQFFSTSPKMLYDVVEPPLGLMYLLTYLNREFAGRIKEKIAKSRIDFDDFGQLKQMLEEFKPDLVGIRALTFHKNFFHQTVAMIRQWGIEAPIVAGGPYASSDYQTILQDPNIDLVVRGEGEITFAELVKKILDNNGKIPGIEVLKEIAGLAFIPPQAQRLRAREVILLDQLNEKLSKENTGNPGHINQASHLAYVIFTSGSTGKPKGTLTTHTNAVRVVKNTNYIAITPNDRVLQLSNYAFDGSVFDIYGALLNGAALVLLNKEEVFAVDRLAKRSLREGINVFFVTTALFNTLVDIEIKSFTNIRKVLFGGERVSVEHTRKALAYMGTGKILHMYGPTETTVYATYHDVAEIDEKLGTILIGKPLANTTVYVMDKASKLVPLGAAGELFIGGDGVARGYLNHPEFTAQMFVPNPIDNNQRLYRSGDLVRWTPGGIEFLDRIDYQVKIRGFRIEMGEIEAQLLKHEKIKEAIVIARHNEWGEKFLCAYIVLEQSHLEPGNPFEPGYWKEFLMKELPDYMIPAYFITLERLPLNPNGKVDRAALPDPEFGGGTRYTAPVGSIEIRLVEIWSEVLGIEKNKISTDANFFEIGGHSLNATRMIAKIHKTLNIKIPLAELFKTPTIRELSGYINKTTTGQHSSIPCAEKKEYYELSSAQKRLYILQEMDFSGTSYNVPMVLLIEGELNQEKLENTFHKIINRHTSFKTSFEIVNENPMQRIYQHVDFKIRYSRLTNNDNREEIITHFVKPFNLSQAPLMRVELIRISPGEETQTPAHILMVDIHHIITDGTSMDLLAKEFKAYHADEELSPLRLQYKDYTEWQNSEEQKEAIIMQAIYWRKQFAGEIPVLNLPVDHPRPAIQSFAGNVICFELSNEQSSALNDLVLSTGATLYMILMAIFNILLAKISGQEDIIVGTPIAARRHVDLEKIIGMFVNTLALRNYPNNHKIFINFLQEVKEKNLEAFENQEYQFENLVEKVTVNRDASRNPLFDVVLALPNIQTQTENLPAAEITDFNVKNLPRENLTAKFDLNVTCQEGRDRLFFAIEYCIKLFKEETIKRFFDYFRRIVSIVTSDINIKLAEIEIIAKEEKEQLLFAFNNTKTAYPRHKAIGQLFEEQVGKIPDHAALIGQNPNKKEPCGGMYLTYRELNEKSNQLAHILIEKGVEHDTIVGIMAERSLEMIVGLLAILKAGGAYMPINPKYPQNRKKYLLEEGNVKILLTNEPDAGHYTRHVLQLDNPGIYYSNSTENLINQKGYARLAYIIYTSGSTSAPKGVMVEQCSVVRLVSNTNYVEFKRNDRILQTGALEFDASTFEIWGALLNGLSLGLTDNDTILTPRKLKEILHGYQITIIWMTSPLFNHMVDADMEIFKNLKNLLVGGDILSPPHINQVKKRFPHLNIINGYGPTENTTFSTTYLIDRRFDRSIPIGKPIANSTVYILDKDNHMVPIGVFGELVVGGDGVSRGYLNDPELTAEKFIPNPIIPGDRSYKTGDRGRWLPDGHIEFLGRIDYQVKIRGFRIEPGEIETYLLHYEKIKEVVVVPLDAPGTNKSDEGEREKYICAYIVPGEEFSTDEIRSYLSEHLPDFMIPAYFVQLEKLPLTPNGKIDRKALPAPEIQIAGEHTAPRDAVEKALAQLWIEILNIKVVGIDDNFFELGGHSLKATILATKINKKLNARIPLAEIFQAPTIRELSQYIKSTTKNRYTSIEPAEKKDCYDSSSVQKRLYLLQQLEPDSIAYNIPLVISLAEEFDIKKLEETFIRLINRHKSLRTSFPILDNQPVQRVHNEIEFAIERCINHQEGTRELAPLSAEPAVGSPQLTANTIKNFVRPFDLTDAPLLRVGLIELPHTPATLRGHPSQEGREHNYLLMADMHHIISDGTSLEILIRDFMVLYSGKALPPLKLSYIDYSEWQHSDSARESMLKQQAYWLRQLEGEIPILNIPTDFPRPAVQSFAGSTKAFEIGIEETKALNQLAAEEKCTLYMVVLAILNIFLSKLCRQEEIIVGSDIAGRSHADLQDIIGMLVNTLVLRNFPRAEHSFTEFLRGVKNTTLEAFENQDYPLEELVEKLALHKDLSRNPLFDVMYTLGNLGISGKESPKPEKTHYTYENPTAKFDLTLTASEGQEQCFLTFEYSTALFKPGTIDRFINYFKAIVSSIVKNKNIQLKGIAIISKEEKKQILYSFNKTREPIEQDKCYHQLFEKQVPRSPDKIAARYNDYQITYKELNEEANSIAYFLLEHRVIPDTIAALYMKRNIKMLVSIIGIFKVGAAYLPLDIYHPQDRIINILKNSEANILIAGTQQTEVVHHLKGIIPHPEHILFLSEKEKTMNEPGKLPAIDRGTIVRSDTLAYIIYTSGTTGTPKGVMIHQMGMINHLYAKINALTITTDDTVAQTASACFDISVWQFLAALLKGGTTFIIDREIVLEPREFLQVLQKGRITILESVPSLMSSFLEASAHESHKDLKSLRWMIPTGEPLTPKLVRDWYQYYPGITLMNAYGPTEASDDVTHYIVEELPNQTRGAIPIGKPLQNLHVYIMDKHLQFCPLGVPGEICIAGIGVGKGYLQSPEITKEYFVPNPYLDEIGDNHYRLLYKTGDIGYFTGNGIIEFLGRQDHQVKLRGFRIELEEIESHLLNHPSIKEAVVTVRNSSQGDKYLCAYYTSDHPPQVSELKNYLSADLPDYMIPSYFVNLDHFPLTPNGKLDRKSLPRPETSRTLEYVAPRNKIEQKLVEIWSEVLFGDSEINQSPIGIDDHFFALGGHSLKATIMVSKIHRELDVKIPLAEVFKTPTPRALAQYIFNTAEDRHASVEPVEKKEYYPLSSAQKRLYILQQIELTATAYNMPEAIPLQKEPDINIKKLQQTFNQLINRHESLRTDFHIIDGEPVQKIHKEVQFEIEIEYYDTTGDEVKVDDYDGTRGLAPLSNEPAVNTIKNFIRPFDLARAPLLRAAMLKTPDEQALLLVDLHHIISDGISHDILVRDFLTLFAGKKLTPLRLQYKDFSQWQNHEKKNIKQQELYWLREFTGEIPVLNLPMDFARPPVQGFAGDIVRFEISPEETRALKKLPIEADATLFMVLLAVYQVLLAKLGNQEDIVVGSPIAGRRHADLEKIIGMFVNTLPLRNYPIGEKSFHHFLSEVKARTLEALENQEYPFEELVDKAAVNRNISRNPLFDVMFTFQNLEGYDKKRTQTNRDHDNTRKTGNSTFENIENIYTNSKFDMTLTINQQEQDLFFTFTYNIELFKKETIERFTRYFKNIISALASDTGLEKKLSQIEILPGEEKKQLLYDFNRTGVELAGLKDKTIHRLFEEQAELIPDRTAVVGQGRELVTYRFVNETSYRLGQHISKKGIGPGDLVGIMVEPALEMMIGIMAILKTGAGYVPLDPGNPRERIEYMMENSEAKLLLTPHRVLEGLEGYTGETAAIEIDDTNGTGASGNLQRTDVLRPGVDDRQTVYMIYTSGTTGKPKGVIITHRNLVNYAGWFSRQAALTGEDRSILTSSFAFDLGYTAVYPLFLRGGQLHILPREYYILPANLLDYIRQQRITYLKMTASFWKAIISETAFTKEACRSLRLLVLGGEPIDVKDVDKTYQVLSHIRIMNHYGPTEATIGCIARFIDPGDLETFRRRPTIGKPIFNTSVIIVDKYLNVVPPGSAGELCVSGVGVGRGYFKREALTSEKFIGNRYMEGHQAEPPYDRVYRTGDQARWLPDPAAPDNYIIEFLGRIDQQVKIRGFRIELGEIENQLLAHPAIKETIVTASADETGDKYLCAYIVLNEKKEKLAPPGLREYLSARLPDYMIPSYFVSIDKIPLTPNGKIDRKALPQPDLLKGQEYTAPRNKIEEKLVEIWSEVLFGSSEIIGSPLGIDDNFFALGGHSLKATIMISKINQQLHVRVPLVEVFKKPYIRQLGEYIASMEKDLFSLKDDNLVLLRKESEAANHLFLIHDGTGEIDGYTELCKHLNIKFNIWGIRTDRLENYTPQNWSILGMANKYNEKIKKVQPHGPYYIAGWSMGGTIAFEMVKQLEQEGNQIKFLGIIDSTAPRKKPREKTSQFNLDSELNFVMNYSTDNEITQKLKNMSEKSQVWLLVVHYLETTNYDVELIKKVIARYGMHALPYYQHLNIRESIYYLNLGRTLHRAAAMYTPGGKIHSPVHYFAAAQSKGRLKKTWKNYLHNSFTFYKIDADHYSILKMPAVVSFAQLFEDVLERSMDQAPGNSQ